LAAVNTLFHDSLRVPLVQSREVDENRDGVVDRLELNLQTPIQAGETIYSATLLAFFDYKVGAAQACSL
jgi:hypothetical protein